MQHKLVRDVDESIELRWHGWNRICLVDVECCCVAKIVGFKEIGISDTWTTKTEYRNWVFELILKRLVQLLGQQHRNGAAATVAGKE